MTTCSLAWRRTLLACGLLVMHAMRVQAQGVQADPTGNAGASNERRGAALNWVRLAGAESCIGATELARRVSERLSRDVFVVAQHAELSFDGYVQTRADGSFSAQLAVSDASGHVLGTRVLESANADCRSLDEALILVTALTLYPSHFGLGDAGIPLDAETNARLNDLFGGEPSSLDPDELSRQREHDDAQRGSRAPHDAPNPAAGADAGRKSQDPSVTRARRPRALAPLDVALSPLMAAGELPGVAFGLDAALTIRMARLWPVRVAVAHLFTRDVRARGVESGAGHFDRTDASLFLCPLSSVALFSFELCFGTAVGVLSASTDGFVDRDRQVSDVVFDLGVQAAASVLVVGPLFVRASADALVPVVQHTYAFQGLDASTVPLYRNAQLAGRFRLGLGVEF